MCPLAIDYHLQNGLLTDQLSLNSTVLISVKY